MLSVQSDGVDVVGCQAVPQTLPRQGDDTSPLKQSTTEVKDVQTQLCMIV